MAKSPESLANKYLKNQCTPEEARQVLEWFESKQGRQYLQDQLEKDMQLLQNDHLFIFPVNIPSAAMQGNILSNLDGANDTDTDNGKESQSQVLTASGAVTRFLGRFMVAALIAGIGFCVLPAYNYFFASTISRSTKYGEISRIILPDSSMVTLNGNSRIEYAAGWKSDEPREIQLEGEAFFSVKHKMNKQPFLVRIGDSVQIEVLGTEFNVSDRKRQTQVVLVTGRIRLNMQVNNISTSTIMTPGESVEIGPISKGMQKHPVDTEVVTSWTANKLIFENTSVREICERLKETYGYQIAFPDQKLMDQHISGSVPNQNIDVVLEGLEVILGVKFNKTKDQ